MVLRDTYNEVLGCNLLDSVVIANQSYAPNVARRRLTGRLSASKPSRAPTKSYSLTNYCTVSGRCRSCTSGTKLFNDALRRILQVTANSINNASFNQCESSPVPASAFNNATLSNLHDAGISDVISVSVSNGSPSR